MRQLMRFLAIVGGAVVLSALVASSTVAAKGNSNTFFVGEKTCTPHATPPLFTCVMSASNVPLLQDATVKYISVPATFPDPAPGRIKSDVVLTTADGASTANGHCTFYMSTHTGLCIYQKGTHALRASQRFGWLGRSRHSCRAISRSSVSTRSASMTTD